uniref:WhiB family transcriptional regulator n=1 Tax=Pseudoclavibacter sp. RFBI5 TaxID=2080578 RepID=UPI0035BE9AEE
MTAILMPTLASPAPAAAPPRLPSPSAPVIRADGSNWRDLRACRDADPDLFFPEDLASTPAGKAQRAEAKRVCRPCPVREQCLALALAERHNDGVWGGLDESGRRSLKRRTRRSMPA